MRKRMIWLAVAVLVAYLGVTVGVFALQRRLMYHPAWLAESPAQLGVPETERHFILSRDGTKLELWMHRARAGFPTLVYFHGNAGNLGNRAPVLAAFAERGLGFVALSYRGFGQSGGTPTEQGIYDDARAAVAFAAAFADAAPGRLIYFGESLGTGVAVQMAAEQPPGLLVLEAAYTSVATRSAELYPYILGANYLVRDRYDSLIKIGRVHAPLLMLHGADDPVIPVAHGRALFAAANEPKRLIIYPHVHHADFSTEQLVAPLLEAAETCGLLAAEPR